MASLLLFAGKVIIKRTTRELSLHFFDFYNKSLDIRKIIPIFEYIFHQQYVKSGDRFNRCARSGIIEFQLFINP